MAAFRIKGIFFILLLSVLSVSFETMSQQFHRIEKSDAVDFQYQWRDADDKQQNLAFTLSKLALFNRFRNFSRYQPKFATAYVNKQLKTWLTQHPLPQVTTHFKKQQGELILTLHSRNQQALTKAQATIASQQTLFLQQYLQQKNYQQFVSADGQLAIKPNHIKIAIDSLPDVNPLRKVILEKVSIHNIRKVTNFVLGFVQSIPYSELESRLTSNGAGFSYPTKLLYENQGDCDSKVTLTGSVLRDLMPRIGIVFVFIKGHALIGLNVTPQDNDLTIEHNSLTYVLAEPTGPALMKLGETATTTEQAILHGQYIVESLPATLPKS